MTFQWELGTSGWDRTTVPRIRIPESQSMRGGASVGIERIELSTTALSQRHHLQVK
jgi:hypothetical protein